MEDEEEDEVWFTPKSAQTVAEWKRLHGRLATYDYADAKLVSHKKRMRTREKHRIFKISLLQYVNRRKEPYEAPKLEAKGSKTPVTERSRSGTTGTKIKKRVQSTLHLFLHLNLPENKTQTLSVGKNCSVKTLKRKISRKFGIRERFQLNSSPDKYQKRFSLWTGNIPVKKVTLTISGLCQTDLFPIKVINCTPKDQRIIRHEESTTDDNIMWVANTSFEQKYPALQYKYKYEVTGTDGRIHKYEEPGYRIFHLQNRSIQDSLNLDFPFQDSEETRTTVFEGCLFYLHQLANDSQTSNSFETSLLDLEHMWHCSKNLLTQENFNRVLNVTEDFFTRALAESDERKILFVIVYGVLLHKRKPARLISLDDHQLRKLLDVIAWAALQRENLTKWSVSYIKQAGLEILQNLHQLHWLTVVAFIGGLYDVDDLLKANMSEDLVNKVNKHRLSFDMVVNVVIPRILNNFGTSETTTRILREIPRGYGFSDDDRHKLSKVVQLYVPHQESSPVYKESNRFEVRNGELCETTESHDQVLTRFRVCVESCKEILAINLHLRVGGKIATRKVRTTIVPSLSYDKFTGSWIVATKDIYIQSNGHDIWYEFSMTERSFNYRNKPDISIVKENRWRQITPGGTAFDIFQHRHIQPIQNELLCNTCAIGTLVNASTVLPETNDNLQQALIDLSRTGFPGEFTVSETFVEFFRGWLRAELDKVNDGQHQSDVHGQNVFYAILLGKVRNAKTIELQTGFISNDQSNILTESIRLCIIDTIPTQLIGDVESVCIWLINALRQNWIYFWQHFSNFIEVEKIVGLRKCVDSPNFSHTQIQETMPQLMSALANLKDKPVYSMKLIVCAIKEICNVKILTELLFQVSNKFQSAVKNYDVDLEASRKCEELLLGHKDNLELLSDLWKEVTCLPMTGIVLVIRDCILRYFKDKDSIWEINDVNVQSLVTDRRIYDNKTSFLEIMSILLMKQTSCKTLYCSQRLYLEVIQKSSILKLLDQQEIKMLIEEAIQSVTSCHHYCRKPHHNEKIEILLQLQYIISNIEYLIGDELILARTDDLICKVLKGIPPGTILEFVCNAEENKWADERLTFLTSYIKKQLCRKDIEEQTQVVMENLRKKQTGGKYTFKSVSVTSILQTFLDLIHTEIFASEDIQSVDVNFSKFEAHVSSTINHSRFIAMLLELACNGTCKFKETRGFRDIVCLLRLIPQKIENGNVSVAFLDEILLRKDDVALMLKYLPDEPMSDDTWFGICNKAFKRKTDFRTKLEFLRKFSDGEGHVPDICRVANVTDIGKVVEEVSCRFPYDLDESAMCLPSADDPEYWGEILYPLTSHAADLNHLLDSEIFYNVCRSFVEGTVPDLDNLEETQELSGFNKCVTDIKSISCTKLIESVYTHCLSTYKKYGDVLARSDLDFPVTIIRDLIGGICAEHVHDELDLMNKECGVQASNTMTEAITSLIKLPDVSQKARQLQVVFGTFDVEDDKNEYREALKTLIHLSDIKAKGQSTLAYVHNAVKKLDEVEKKFQSGDSWSVVEQLINCKELIRFVRRVIDDDLRNLIDAVEERSDQNMNEHTVSALIDVQRFMRPLLKVTPSNQPSNFIHVISTGVCRYDNLKASERQIQYNKGTEKHLKDLKALEKLSMKINTCVNNVHSLEDLYNSVANRGEVTKEKISNAVKDGEFEFKLKNNCCVVGLKYDRSGQEVTHSLDELNDLRSRALLIVNSRKQTEDASSTAGTSSLETQEVSTFLACITIVNDIVSLCGSLMDSGHFDFREFNECAKTLLTLQDIRDKLQAKLNDWQNDILEARNQFFLLNFFQAKQLGILDGFFNQSKMSEVPEDVELLFRFVNPTIKIETSLRSIYEPSETKVPKDKLHQLGKALNRIFYFKDAKGPRFKPTRRLIPTFGTSSESCIYSKVTPGNIFVAELEIGSTKVINVLLQLYQHTTRTLPEPSQIVFCNSSTPWEEIWLLLQRCKAADQEFPECDLLYTLVNVEQLPTKIQVNLVAEVKSMKKSRKRYLLALICCAGHYHHIIDQFSPTYTHELDGCSDSELQRCLTTGWPSLEQSMVHSKELYPDRVTSMTFLTSTRAGLGKTEYVRQIASSIEYGINTLHVSGSFTKDQVIKMLSELPRKKRCILHIDAAEMEQRQMFDCFIFETVVIGMAVSGTLMCASPSPVIVLEVANTHGNVLTNSLHVCRAFPRKELEWPGFDKYVVSEDIRSPVQVVCHYLKALDNETLNSKDINLVGDSECKAILKNEFRSEAGLSFTVVETFLSLFAQELRRMSVSLYFKPKNVKRMVEQQHVTDLRSNLVSKMKEVSKQFSARSVKMPTVQSSNYPMEIHTCTVSAATMVSRMENMVMWNESNHLFIVFHRQDSQTLTPIYRDIEKIPDDIKQLLQTQTQTKTLIDYSGMSHEELQNKLEMICRKSNQPFDRSELADLESSYALTTDNFLKMILIYLRIESSIPVVIMGETGCGKTTLVTYLARVCDVPFFKLNLHAGVTEERITSEMQNWREKAEKCPERDIWVFLDEINTCNHLGSLSEVVCHHMWRGEHLPSNMKFIAACNPYRLREKSASVGLAAKPNWERDEQSKLVYRVHPLPETMTDYVWDYGALNENDECAYIKRMLGQNNPTFVALIVVSQKFLREKEGNDHCVSLRDVHRCKHLKEYFETKFFTDTKSPCKIDGFPDDRFGNTQRERSIVLALCHCYHSRLIKANHRMEYLRKIAEELTRLKEPSEYSDFEKIIEMEQMDLLNRMELPSGIAKNEALRENIFVMLVSILNNIPVFVIGKPGCSKSLSMQLIKSNLRGPDSPKDYFKSLPPVYVISYQGSESSTSDGIIKVFDKAKNYKKHNPNILPVVLLDEIGLAENSSFNPLRVLHSQLEPNMTGFPSVAVVGISNWELDSAKMNRAIHLSRPEPTKKDLQTTAVSIRDNIIANEETIPTSIPDVNIQILATSYFEYKSMQIRKNFHGLRDYYSLVKYVVTKGKADRQKRFSELVVEGILRNFGGSQEYLKTILNTFTKTLPKMHQFLKTNSRANSVLRLLSDNLNDENARHLMLITRGDLALSILEQHLHDHGLMRDYKIIYGSKFSGDKTEEYSYQMLSQIILCMESGILLVMKDLEGIYESLYDMLNQNYTIIGKKKNCRVALGPHSNPMCQVPDCFRCVVVVDEKKLDLADPPFLNRFEKQFITLSEVMSDVHIDATKMLNQWTLGWTEKPGESREDIENSNDVDSSKQIQRIFLGFNKDTLASLSYSKRKDNGQNAKKLAEICENDLLNIACPDAVLNLTESRMYDEEKSKVIEIRQRYLDLPLHQGFYYFYETQISTRPNAQVIIYTHSSIHFDFEECLAETYCQVEKLSNFKSQEDLSNAIQTFWESNDTLLILQCMPSLDVDAANMALAKCLLDQYRKEYLQERKRNKHLCIVVHCDRGLKKRSNKSWHFSFLCGWQQFTIDSLDNTSPVLDDCLRYSLAEMLDSERMTCEKLIDTSMLIWCFNCIRYTENPRSVDSSLQLAYSIFQSDEIMAGFFEQIHRYLSWKEKQSKKKEPYEWQTEVASNTGLLMTCSTLVGAMQEHLRNEVRKPLAKIIIFLERYNSWSGSNLCHSTGDISPEDNSKANTDADVDSNTDARKYWLTCFKEVKVFDITSKDIEEPRGSETCPVGCSSLNIKYPFFTRFHKIIDTQLQWLVEQNNIGTRDDLLHLQLYDLLKTIPNLNNNNYLTRHSEDFIYDLLNAFSERFAPNMSADLRVEVMKLLLLQPESTPHHSSDTFKSIADHYIAIWENQKTLSAELQLISTLEKTTGDVHTLLDQLQQLLSSDSKIAPGETGLSLTAVVIVNNVDTVENVIDEFDAHQEVGGNEKLQRGDEHQEVGDDGKLQRRDEHQEVGGDENMQRRDEHQDVGGDVKLQRREGHQEVGDDGKLQRRDDHQEVGGGEKLQRREEHPEVGDDGKLQKRDEHQEVGDDGKLQRRDENQEVECHPIDNDKHIDAKKNGDIIHSIIVTQMCKALLPFKTTLDKYGSLDKWQQMAYLVLLLSQQVANETSILEDENMGSETSILYFLKLCCDFATLTMSLKWANAEKAVAELADLAHETHFKDVLDNEKIFEYVYKEVSERGIPKAEKEQFLSTYFNFCLDANLDTPILRHIILKSFKEPEPLPIGSRPVLRKILYNDIEGENAREVCEDFILRGTIDEEDYPNLFAIDEALRGLDRESHLTVACCDIIEGLAFKSLSWVEIRDTTSKECPLLETARSAIKVVFLENNDRDEVAKSSMQYVCACSYLRSFISASAQFFNQKDDPRLFKTSGQHYLLGDALNDMLCSKDGELNPLLVYFFKCLKQIKANCTLFNLMDWTKRMSDAVAFLKSLKFQEHLFSSCIGYNPVSYLPYYTESIRTVKSFINKRDSDAEKEVYSLIDMAKSDIDRRLGLIAAFSEAFYWVKNTTGTLPDTVLTEKLSKKVRTTFSDSFGLLVERLLTNDESEDMMIITSATDLSSVHKVSIILHAACLDIAWKEIIEVPRHEDCIDQKLGGTSEEFVQSDCVCGFSTLSRKMPSKCLTCNRPHTKDTATKISLDTENNSIFECRDLQNVVSQLIQDSVFLARLLCSETECKDHIPVDVTNQPREDISIQEQPTVDEPSNQTIQNTVKVQEKIFNDRWQRVGKLLGIDDDDETISILLHTVLQNMIAERDKGTTLECTLDRKILDVLGKPNIYQDTYLQGCFKSQGVNEKHIEYQIYELPYQQGKTPNEHTKPRLLRRRIHLTFAEFERRFVLEIGSDQTQFQFLQLYLRYKDALQYVRHLPVFLKWNSLVAKRLSKSMERKQAEDQQIQSVLQTALEGSDAPDELTGVIFKQFQRAWNDVCEGWESLTGSPSNLKRMSYTNSIISCVMDPKNKDCEFFQIMQVLQKTQNNFLNNALAIASSTYSSSLNFLVHEDGVSAIHRVTLDNANKEIINFQWSDKLLQEHSDIGTEYGDGRSVCVNFVAIEKELARDLVMNKSILSDGRVFSLVPFSDELLHASSVILRDIKKVILQKDLDADSKETVNTKIQDIQFANTLKENLEIMLVLLKKTGGDPETPLNEYIERWSTQLPGSFPRDMLPKCQEPITLSHVVDLYRIIEDHLADLGIDDIDSKFRTPLQSKLLNDMRAKMEGVEIKQMASSAKLIRLFAFRYLRPSHKVGQTTLNACLMGTIIKESAEGTLDIGDLGELIKEEDGVKVRHIFKLQELIEDEIKNKEKAEIHSQNKPVHTQQRRSRRRVAKE